ncbi:MAG: molybdopterin-guanine dinucleotide biosynthesis protein B [Acetobacterium woodii]|nr:molybdopterin-guanine dinucleotide biosynthesis protein B [Acetobacterium woodii]
MNGENMKQNIPVYSFVAWSGVGKTTLLEKLIPELKSRGMKVAVIKHDDHEFEIDKKGKDSWRMTQAGADVTVIASDTQAAIMENRRVSMDVLLSHVANVDLILTEGYKLGPWPKIGICRSGSGKVLPEIKGNYLAVVSDLPLDVDCPGFALDDKKNIADFIIADMKKSVINNEVGKCN